MNDESIMNIENTANDIERLLPNAIGTDNRIIILIISMIAVLMIIIPILILLDRKKNRQWGVKKNLGGRQKLSDQIFPPTYRFLMSFPLSRNYMERIAYRYRLISPCDKRVIAKKTVSVCLLSWGICLLTFLLVFACNPKLSTLIIMAAAIIIINAEVVGRITKAYMISVLIETQKLILDLQHNFHVEYRVDDAFYRSRDNMSPNMKVVVDQIYQLLLSEDKDEALREYYENIPNRFLRALVSQCVAVMDRGDKVIHGQRLFIINLEKLYNEMDIEIEKQHRLSNEFLGVIAIVIAPIFCIDFVKSFAINIKENMANYYYGKQGFLLDLGLILLILTIYVVMRKSAEYASFRQSSHRWLYKLDKIPLVKRAMDNYCDKNATKIERLRRELRNNGNNIRPRHFVLRNFVIALIVLILSTGISVYLHELSRNQLLVAERADIEVLTSAAKVSHYDKMAEVIETYTTKYVFSKDRNMDIPRSMEDMVTVLEKDRAFSNKLINEALAKDILGRVDAYHNEYYSFDDLFISLLLSFASYFLPRMLLRFNASVSKDAMEDEVNQMNGFISMLMHHDSMTVKQILIELEAFAVVFKQSLRNCINDYGAGDINALLNLKESEPYEPFGRIVDNLIRCDDMPISQAFHEIDVERDGYMSKRKLANEKSIKKRVLRAYLLAALPFMMLFAYGIVPPLLASMTEINTMLRDLENTSW